MTGKRLTHNDNKQAGFTLLEVLIAMVILAIGLFGLAGLQTASLRANASAYQRSVASMLANDILDRMRGNPAQIALRNGDGDYTGNGYDGTFDTADSGTYPAAPADNACQANDSDNCTPDLLRAFDLNEWVSREHKLRQLPAATATISTVTIPASSTDPDALNVTVTITWQDFDYSGSQGLGSHSSNSFIYSSIIRI